MSIQPLAYKPQYQPSSFQPAQKQHAAEIFGNNDRAKQLVRAASRFNPTITQSRTVPLFRASSGLGVKSLPEQVRSGTKFGQESALKIKEQGFSRWEGIKHFSAQKDLANYLSVLNEVLSVAASPGERTNSVGVQSPNSHTEALGTQIGAAGQGMLLDHLQQEGVAQVVDWLDIAADDQASLEVVDAIIGSVTGRSSSSAGQSIDTANLSEQASAVLGAAGAAYSAYELIDNFGDMTLVGGMSNGAAFGSYVGTMIMPGVGTAIGGAIGAIGGGIMSLFHDSGKGVEQQARDRMREFLHEAGLIDQDHKIQLADGSFYDIGKDGGHRYINVDGNKRQAFDVDFSNPLSHQSVGMLQPLATVLTGGNPKLKDDLTGYLVNAAQSNATTLAEVRQNALAFMQSLGLGLEQVANSLIGMAKEGALSESQALAYIGGLRTLQG
jgi:hypothetical protein